jgi:Pentapeptide repeats (8 copies)
MDAKTKRARWIALGTILGVVAAWGGLGIVGIVGAATSAPSTITTCTKAKNGKTKVIYNDYVYVERCSRKGKGFAKVWVDLRYRNYLQNISFGSYSLLDLSDSNGSRGVHNYSNFILTNFTNASLGDAQALDSDFRGANFTGADLSGADFTGANFATAIWSNTTCPDGTNSNDNSGTCIGHL